VHERNEARPEGTLQTVRFPAVDGTAIEAWLLLPSSTPAPLVVMAPGLTGTKDGPLEAFAWRFVAHGLAVLLLDFRTIGGSEGTPRHWVDPVRHREDYEAALRFARESLAARGSIDPERIAVWGTSFSGGTALLTAARDPKLRAVVAQAPYLETQPRLQPRGLGMARYVVCATLDMLPLLPPVYVPVFGRPGEWVFAPSLENPSVGDPDDPAAAAFWRALPQRLHGGWSNRMLARMLPTFDAFRPIDAIAQIHCPVLLVAAEHDDLVPLAMVERAHGLLPGPGATKLAFPCGHFDLYVGPCFEPNAKAQAEFLVQHLTRDDVGRSAA
jgi:pimeloyl-ACP methyl ester carboxylesterase